MPSFAPRIPLRLLEALERIDDPSVPIAETNRRLAAEAARLGVPRPSYQRVRELVQHHRALTRGPSTLEVLADVALRARAPEEFVDHLSGVGVRRVR